MESLFKHLEPDDTARVKRALPPEVFGVMHKRRTILAGGFIRATIVGEEPKDIDLFVRSKDEAIQVAHALSKDGHALVTPNAITLRAGYPVPVQVIHRWTYQNARELLDSFDFTVARACIEVDAGGRGDGLCDERFYRDLAARRLIYRAPIREEEPGGSLLRVLRFHAKGYRMPLADFAAVVNRACAKLDFCADQEAELLARLREVDPPNEQGLDVVLTFLADAVRGLAKEAALTERGHAFVEEHSYCQHEDCFALREKPEMHSHPCPMPASAAVPTWTCPSCGRAEYTGVPDACASCSWSAPTPPPPAIATSGYAEATCPECGHVLPAHAGECTFLAKALAEECSCAAPRVVNDRCENCGGKVALPL
jgi:hypothetical protein